MKNKIELSENDAIQKRVISAHNENQNAEAKQKLNKKTRSKVIKGKVKTYKNTIKPRLIHFENLDDESELNLISERMLLFLKVTFLFLIITALFICIKKSF